MPSRFARDDRPIAVEYRPIPAHSGRGRKTDDPWPHSEFGLGRQIPLSELTHEATLGSLARWLYARGARRFPLRERFASTEIGGFVRHAAIAQRVEGAAEYRFRFAGVAYQDALGIALAGKSLAGIAETHPRFAGGIRRMFDQVCRRGEPVALRGSFEADNAPATQLRHESVFLPFGQKKIFVDHVLHVGVYERIRPHDATAPDRLNGQQNSASAAE